MPGQARLDAPGMLHHVIVRGIEKGKIKDFPWQRQVVRWGFHLTPFHDDSPEKEQVTIVNYVPFITAKKYSHLRFPSLATNISCTITVNELYSP
jgi:hypothetical protein